MIRHSKINDLTFQKEFLVNSVADYKKIENSLIETIRSKIINNFFNVDYHSDDNTLEKFKVQKTGKIDLSYINNRIMIMDPYITSNPKFKFKKEEVNALANVFKHNGMKNRHIEHKDFTEKPYNDITPDDYPISSLFYLIKDEIKNLTLQFDFFTIGFFLMRIGTDICFKNNISVSVQRKLAQYFKDTFIVMKEYFPEELIDKALAEFKFNFPKNTGNQSDLYGISVKPDGEKSVIVLNKKYITQKNNQFLISLLSEVSPLISGVVLDDCIFRGISIPVINNSTLFKNTTFLDFFAIENFVNQTLIFDNCIFQDKFIMEKCTIDNVFVIRNSQFYKEFKLGQSKLNRKTEFSHLTFWDIFDFSDCVLGTECHFKNFAYNSEKSPQTHECKKKLSKILDSYGYHTEITNLDLTDINNKKSGKIDMDAYQAAYATGYLNPDYAAFLLGRSTSYLAKKRANDRQRIVRDSLPFIVSGRDVQYPVEAFLALKSQNWTTLKELRQKYPIPKDVD